jgi:SNF2 family DNA or RNA helicase
MSQEDAILRFLSEGRSVIECETSVLDESRSIKALRKNLVVIQPLLETNESNSREVSVLMSFRGSDGARFDTERIGQFLRAGKRLIQTSDGKSLILPKESWEVFQRTATDLHWKQEKGVFLAKNTQLILIDYLRKYFDKFNKSNNLAISDLREFPLLHAELRDYQKQGAQWLHERLESHGFALLADEMGLGKTLQTIAAMTLLATPERPALVVVPTSLLYNWEAEIRRFAPSLKTIILYGGQRESLHGVSDAHVIVTSYGVLMNDRALFLKREFSLMVLDEASAIRNPDTDLARCCYRMNASCRLALTGTPLENGLQDLWSIFHYLQPGYLGERQPFRDRYERSTPDSLSLQSLRLRVMPFLLRRTKNEVVKELPAKVETDEWCEMSPNQSDLYQKVWEQGAENIEKLIKAKDSSAHMSLLTLLLRLRQICCDAGLYAPELREEWSLEQRSGKMKRLFDLIYGSLSSGRKILVFSQFATQLRNIEAECQHLGIETLRLDGATRHRQEMVDRFQSETGPPVFLISLKAGGYGLNLTAASTVIHFDPWWNPAAEQQASDRAHRIGQSQPVNVYRLLTRDTVEERVKLLQSNKARLAEQMFGSDPQAASTMPSMDELSKILQTSNFHNQDE